jgi:hypothetical protein
VEKAAEENYSGCQKTRAAEEDGATIFEGHPFSTKIQSMGRP